MKKLAVLWAVLICCVGCKAEVTEENLSQVHFVKAEWEIGDKTPEERAMAVKNRLGQVDGVIGTAVVVEGHTAIIGLRLKEKLEQNEISAVKKEVEQKAKGAGVFIETTSITTNSYIVSLIEQTERKRAG
jgi:hypothetical protein